jgi:hypothetical protein
MTLEQAQDLLAKCEAVKDMMADMVDGYEYHDPFVHPDQTYVAVMTRRVKDAMLDIHTSMAKYEAGV